MKRIRIATAVLIILSWLLTWFVGCGHPSPPGSFTDDSGRVITIDKTPERLISHVPGITEILFALGLGGKVVGVSTYCDYPPEAQLKAKVGGFWNPTIENIVALSPDLVFTMGSNKPLMTALDALKITYIVLQPKDIEGVLRDIELVGKVTNTAETAEKLIRDMQERILHVADRVKGARRPKVFYIIEAENLNSPWTAGPGSFIDSLISTAGGENIGAKAQAPWSQFSIEEIVNSDPDIIIIPTKHGTAFTAPEAFKEHPIWQKITAVRLGRIFTIDDDLTSRYGPRIALGLEEMARIIHPELFK